MNIFELASTFITIAHQGSIQSAARYLHQTEAAISKKLKKLEEHLKTQLIIRKRTGLLLTEAGQHYYQLSKATLEQFAQAEAQLRQKQKEAEGVLTIVSNDHYFQHRILPGLPAFMKKYPKIKLNFKLEEILPDFKYRSMDIIFGSSNPGDNNLVRKRIEQTRYVLCASPKYLKQHGVPRSSSELLQHHFIAHTSRQPANRIVFDDEEAIVLNPILSMNTTNAMIESCLKHVGFIWTHETLVKSYLHSKKLEYFLEKKTKNIYDVYVYYQYQTYSNLCIKAFIDFFT